GQAVGGEDPPVDAPLGDRDGRPTGGEHAPVDIVDRAVDVHRRHVTVHYLTDPHGVPPVDQRQHVLAPEHADDHAPLGDDHIARAATDGVAEWGLGRDAAEVPDGELG